MDILADCHSSDVVRAYFAVLNVISGVFIFSSQNQIIIRNKKLSNQGFGKIPFYQSCRQ